MNRREFVILGSTALAGVALASPLSAASSDPSLSLSVGYWDDDRPLHTRHARPPRSFVRADSVLTGDPKFFSAGGARFRVHGFTRAIPAAEPDVVLFDVLYPVEGSETKVPYFALTGRSWGNASKRSVAFDVPVDPSGTLDVRVSRQIVRDGGMESVVVPFAINSADGALKLNTGTYAVAVLRPGDPQPDWSAVHLVLSSTQVPRPAAQLVEDTVSGTQPVRFDHLLYTVSFPTAS